jgi:phosphatidylglycerol:prolipoprotein diacylglycerol transferase
VINPIALQVGPLTVHWYGLIMALAFSVATFIAYKRTKQEGYDPEHIINMLMIILPSSILGARLYYVLFEWQHYADDWLSAFAIWEGGLAIHGGLIGGTIAGFLYVKKHQLPVLKMADIIAPGVIIAQAIGRWGNFVNQEAHGGPVSESFISYFPTFIKNQMFIQGQYVHPTFLYESLWNLGVFIVLLLLRGKKKFDGQIVFAYLMMYSVGRFFIEGLRTDSLMIGPLRTAQMISLILIIVSIIVLIMLYNKTKGQTKHSFDETLNRKTGIGS